MADEVALCAQGTCIDTADDSRSQACKDVVPYLGYAQYTALGEGDGRHELRLV